MTSELRMTRPEVSKRQYSIAEAIAKILPRGHVIHGYSSGGSTRLLMVLESRTYSDKAPLLGFGADGNAERALARALLTYAIREEQGLDYITETQLPESYEAQVGGGRNSSRFDNIVWGGDFKLFQDKDTVVAASRYGGGWGLEKLEVRGEDPLSAIVNLTNQYRFSANAPHINNLPSISLE